MATTSRKRQKTTKVSKEQHQAQAQTLAAPEPPPTRQEQDTFLALSAQLEVELQRMHEVGQDGVQQTQEQLRMFQAALQELGCACAAARDAQQLLQSQADNLGTMAMAAGGRACSVPELAVATQAAEAAFAKGSRATAAVIAALRATVEADEFEPLYADTGILHKLLGLQAAAAAPLKRMWNQSHSALLNLPDAVLNIIARMGGKGTRLVCRHMDEVFGSPGSILDLREIWGSFMPALPASPITMASSWPWADQVRELRLCDSRTIDLQARKMLVTMLPKLQRLQCGNSGTRRTKTPQPKWDSITELSYVLVDNGAVVLPFTLPNLQRLHLRFPYGFFTTQRLNLTESLLLPRLSYAGEEVMEAIAQTLSETWRQCPGLTSLCLHGFCTPGLIESPPELQPALGLLTALQHLSLELLLYEAVHLSCLQSVSALKHLQLGLRAEKRDDYITAPSLSQLTQLQMLTLEPISWCECWRDSCVLKCVQHAAALPQLRELDLVGLGPLHDRHEVRLRPLLSPECHVRCLRVHVDSPGAVEAAGAAASSASAAAVSSLPLSTAAAAGAGPQQGQEQPGHGAVQVQEVGVVGASCTLDCAEGVVPAAGAAGPAPAGSAAASESASAASAAALSMGWQTWVCKDCVYADTTAYEYRNFYCIPGQNQGCVGISGLLAQLWRKMDVVWQPAPKWGH